MPLLEIDGRTLVHSWAIYRVVAELCGLEPSAREDRYHLEQALETFREWHDACTHYMRVRAGFLKGDAVSFFKLKFKKWKTFSNSLSLFPKMEQTPPEHPTSAAPLQNCVQTGD